MQNHRKEQHYQHQTYWKKGFTGNGNLAFQDTSGTTNHSHAIHSNGKKILQLSNITSYFIQSSIKLGISNIAAPWKNCDMKSSHNPPKYLSSLYLPPISFYQNFQVKRKLLTIGELVFSCLPFNCLFGRMIGIVSWLPVQ